MGIAHELITRGWHQGNWRDDEGRVCLMGAAACSASSFAEFERAVIALQQSARTNVVHFNDMPGRTFDEVLRVAKQADEILDTAA